MKQHNESTAINNNIKLGLAEKKAIVAIISGILAIIITVSGLGISMITWKNYHDYKLNEVIHTDILQDKKIEKLEISINETEKQLSALNAKMDYVIKMLDKTISNK